VDTEVAREKVAGIEAIVRGYEVVCDDAEGAEAVAASIIDGIKANRSQATYNLIDLPSDQVAPERTFALSDIMNELETYQGYFPHEALAAAIADPELVTPALLQSIRYATDEAEYIADERRDYMAHLYAIHLLAQFRETRAYPLVVAFVSLPEDLLFEIAGDFVTEGLGQVLASVCGGDQRLIRELLEDEKIDEFVRRAAMHALVCLVVAGQAEREDVLDYFGELLRSDFAHEPSYVLDDLILYAAHLCPTGIIDDIRAAYESGVADDGYILLEEVEERLRTGPEAALNALSKDRSYALISDTLEDMKWWACIREDGALTKSSMKISTRPISGRCRPRPTSNGFHKRSQFAERARRSGAMILARAARVVNTRSAAGDNSPVQASGIFLAAAEGLEAVVGEPGAGLRLEGGGDANANEAGLLQQLRSSPG
jgi:hypothetical protein